MKKVLISDHFAVRYLERVLKDQIKEKIYEEIVPQIEKSVEKLGPGKYPVTTKYGTFKVIVSKEDRENKENILTTILF